MFTKLKNNLVTIVLILIIVLAFTLRTYKLSEIPPSLNWDEAAAAYNAWSIATYGRDEFGEVFPLIFKSFLDDKHPVHIYATAIIVKILGLNDFTVRFSAAMAGVSCVILIYLLGKSWFSQSVGLFAAFFLAVSPYNIHFSRGLWETNFTLLLYLVGLYCFYRGLTRQGYWFVISFLGFGISMMSYHASKVIVPPTLLLLICLYIRKLIKIGWSFYVGIITLLIISSLLIIEPRLLGLARANQNRYSNAEIENTYLFKKTQNSLFGNLEIVYTSYLKHYTANYLFIQGDTTPRNSTKAFGQFYWIDGMLGILGLVILIAKRSKVAILLLSWLFLAPLPSSLVQGAPQATRALFMMGSIQLLVALGAGAILEKLKNFKFKIFAALLIIAIYLYSLSTYTTIYYKDYAKEHAIDWQYGMKQIVEYVRNNPDYNQVYMTKERSQPYIFFLYYLKYPLPDFLRWVEYNQDKSVSHNLVSNFDKYNFGNWDTVESMPNNGYLYILTPSEYDGLKHKINFEVKKRVLYPSGADAFFIVTSK